MADLPTSTSTAALAHAKPCDLKPISNEQLHQLVMPFTDASIGQRYRGPSFLTSEQVPCVVVLTHDQGTLRRIRDTGRFGLIAWRWDNTPSMFLSLTLALSNRTPRPHARWMAPSNSEVIQRIRQTGRFLTIVAMPDGRHSGWHEAVMTTVADADPRQTSTSGLRALVDLSDARNTSFERKRALRTI